MAEVWRSIEEPAEDVVLLRGRIADLPASFERYYARAGRPSARERRADALHRTASFAFSSVLHLLALILLVEFIYISTPLVEEAVLTARLHRPGPAPEVARTEPTPQPEPLPQRVERAAEAPVAAETPRPEAPAPVIGAGARQGEPKILPVGVLENPEPIPESDLAHFTGPGSFEHRSGKARSDAVGRYGGTLASEAAVELGLDWLAAHQSPDGRWSPSDFVDRCPGRDSCADFTGPSQFDHGITGLVLLAFLGAGTTHREGKHKDAVALGLQWLAERQDPSGFFFDPADPRSRKGGMYGHGMATYALGEAASMTGDEALLPALRRAVVAIEAAQRANGGWYYTADPEQRRSELTLSVWQMMGLKAAEKAGVPPPMQVWDRATKHLLEQQAPNGGFRYSPGSDPTMGATGAGVFARCLLGFASGNGVERGLAWLELEKKSDPDPARGDSWQYLYAWYYRTLATFQVQGPAWREWNRKLRPFLVSRQRTRGHAAGSWGIIDYREASSLYATALCVLMLETYYRYLPASGGRGAVMEAVAGTSSDAPTPEEERRIDEVRPPSADEKAARRLRELADAREKLGSAKPEDRYVAARKLAEQGDAEAAPAMIEAARKESGRLRAAHLLFLGRLKSTAAVPFLMGELDADDRDIRGAAMSALTSITGIYITEPARWRDWWRDLPRR
jgi:hypothetical protein